MSLSSRESANEIEFEKDRCIFFILGDQTFLKSFVFGAYYKALIAISEELKEGCLSSSRKTDKNVASSRSFESVLKCGLELNGRKFVFELATIKA